MLNWFFYGINYCSVLYFIKLGYPTNVVNVLKENIKNVFDDSSILLVGILPIFIGISLTLSYVVIIILNVIYSTNFYYPNIYPVMLLMIIPLYYIGKWIIVKIRDRKLLK